MCVVLLNTHILVLSQVWDTDSNTMVKELPAQNHWVRALVVSDEFLYSGSYQAVKVILCLIISIRGYTSHYCRYGIQIH